MTDLIDHRQREAAAILLGTVDLPAPLEATARLWLRASEVCPGITWEASMYGAGRRRALLRVRELVDQMLAELEPETWRGAVDQIASDESGE